MRQFIAFIVAVLAFATTVQADQSRSISGRVTDSVSGIPLPGATVQILSTTKGANTRNDGSFTLLGVPSGMLRLRISCMGYAADTVAVDEASAGRFVNVALSPKSVTMDQVVVAGEIGMGQARALSQQRAGGNITNIVSADQIGRFPDQNIGDAMKRIPGIAVQYDQGEARFGLIRGTPGQFNSVMINGERIPSAEAENRQVQLDLVPADMVRAIEVNKTLTPDMDADAIGGAVNLVTRDAAIATRGSATLGSGYNFLSGRPMVNGAFIGSTRLFDDKFGVVLSGSYFDHILGSDNIEAIWGEGANGTFLEEFEVRQYNVRRIRRSISAGLDYRFDPNNVIRLAAIYNSRDDWENRYRLRYIFKEDSDETQIRRQTKGGKIGDPAGATRLEDQRTMNATLSGEHTIANALRLTWSGTLAKASEERPFERYIQFRTRKATTSRDISNPSNPIVTETGNADLSTFGLHELSEQYGYTEDVDANGRVDVSFNWLEGDYANIVKAGARYRTKTKNRNNNYFEYEPTSGAASFDEMTLQPLADISKDNFLAGPYRIGRFVDHTALGSYSFGDTSQFAGTDLLEEYAAGNFDASEHILAGYAMIEQNIGDNFEAIAGVRFESTSNRYNGNQYNIDDNSVSPISNTSSYVNILPSVNMKYTGVDRLVLRGAWTNTLARPNYFDLVPYRIVSFGDGDLSEGNPNLKPTTSMNIDLMAEYYFQSVGIVSMGVFSKSINDFVFTSRQNGYVDPVSGQTFRTYSKPLNGGSASLMGVEAAFQRQLDFLPGVLAGFSVYLNYTYATSTVEGIVGRENESLPLAGNPNHSLNASLAYEWGNFSMRVAANWTSAYIDEYGESAFFDRYYDKQLFVDANASYRILPNLRLFVDANNLTNQPLRYFQGVATRVAQAEFYNARFQAGIKFDI
jgi:TonB-dependent receptor